jgi:hypothetical protein
LSVPTIFNIDADEPDAVAQLNGASVWENDEKLLSPHDNNHAEAIGVIT